MRLIEPRRLFDIGKIGQIAVLAKIVMLDQHGRQPRRHQKLQSRVMNAADHRRVAQTITTKESMPAAPGHFLQRFRRHAPCQQQ